MENGIHSINVKALSLISLALLLGLSQAFLFKDGCQLDGGLHFLYAKWAWTHNELFVGVWSRPLYTFFYAFPSLLGYRAARLFTVLICLVISWQTWRLAKELNRTGKTSLLTTNWTLAIILVWLQPSFFLFSADNMTEPIFALVFVIALRLHHKGYIKFGLVVASLMILARPEGFFLGILWAIWVLIDYLKSVRFVSVTKLAGSSLPLLLLLTGSVIWWVSALIITGDPLFIVHNWPPNWPVTGTVYGAAGLLAYPARLPEIAGPFLLPVFITGIVMLIRKRELHTITSSFLLMFIIHTLFRAFGLLGSAGYPRYMITVTPAIALITLAGWNVIAGKLAHTSSLFRTALGGIIVALSLFLNLCYADGAEWSRDARAIDVVHSWFIKNPVEIVRLIWSEPYSCILFERDPWENPAFTGAKEDDIEILRALPARTLAVWDEKVGPKWYQLTVSDFEKAGFVKIYSQSFSLEGYILDRPWFGFGGPRQQTIHLLYKYE